MEVVLSLNNHTDVVRSVNWLASATTTVDGVEYSEGGYGNVYLKEPEGEDFIPFEDLTKDNVIAWVKESLGEDQIKQTENSLANLIRGRIQPSFINKVPSNWNLSI